MKPGRILVFIASVIALLAALGAVFPAEGIMIGDRHIGFTSLHALAAQQQKPDIELPKETPEMLQLRDSVAYYRHQVEEGSLRLWLPNRHYMDTFWQTAEKARRNGRTVRVLHYGDSQIEMDHITSRLRTYMQRTFGGGGPGMVPFQTITPSMTISQSTAGELIHLSSFGDSTVVRSRGDYGPMMQCFRMAGGNATLTLRGAKSKSVDDRAKRFSRITLVYNNRSQHLSADLADRQHRSVPLPAATRDGGIGSFSWLLDSATAHVRLTVSGNADLYGVLVDDGPGIAVDNIPMRGCSGQQFTLVPEDKLASAYRQLDVGMIILQFGGNSVPYIKTSKQISTYCQSIGKQIDHLHRCCPGATLLFVGPSDMSTRLRGQLQTYPALPELIDSLAATATTHGAAYWSIYHAMGGLNSMPEWSRQGLAGQDYIHFSQRGADLMGDRLSQALDNSYRLFCLERKMKQEKAKHVQ